ncbi:MAG TPA: hypothetical protein VM328_05770, partial [Fimbriimonadaceae bacterium]|nr:hypothetical protein [Fimbriimonadaceae bacterium]
MEAQREAVTSSALDASYELLRESCGVLDHLDLAVIELRGDDRKGWLQGQVTNDLRSFTTGTHAQFCFVSVTGQIEADCWGWALQDRILITTSQSAAAAVMDRCRRMVILEDVQARLVDELRLLSIQGPEATRELTDRLPLPSLDAGDSRYEDAPVVCLRSNRTGYGGWDLLAASEAASKIAASLPAITPEAYDVARLEAGIPLMGRDIDSRTLPPELGDAFEVRNVSYSKGCYLGQEVLMRLHARGHTNRTWMALLSEEVLEQGAIVSHASRPDAGVVTSASWSPRYGAIAAAMIRREAS